MAYTTINKSTDYFNTKLYTGTGSSNAQTGIGHQPDLVWIKSRSATWDHEQYDVVRGVGKSLSSVTANAEGNSPQGVTAFGSDGFTVGTRSGVNENNSTYASWNWKAGGGQGSSNTAGSINTTYTSVNTTAGFSISSFTGTGANATFGHGLGVVPKFYILKRYDQSNNWRVYHHSVGNGKYLTLETTEAEQTSSGFTNNTDPTSSLISLGNLGSANPSGGSVLCYAFAEKTGYSKFGKYTGNGNADGPMIYTGFKPAFILCKITSSTSNWRLFDNKRIGYNVDNNPLYPNVANAEGTEDNIDILSNGFKWRTTDGALNGSGATYIYAAFGQSLVGSNNVPVTAR